MAQTNPAEETRIIDSLLHTNYKRVFVGALCGIAAGALLLVLSMLFTPPDASKLWFLQLMASMFYGGGSSAFDVAAPVLICGLIVHFAFSVVNGLIFGKMTTSSSTSRLIGYGVVLGALCWLASNMFAPDLLSVEGLQQLAQWPRAFLFVTFGASIGLFMSLASKALKI